MADSEQVAFAQKLKYSLDAIMDSYSNMLNSSRITGRDCAEREKLQLTAHAAGVVGETQTLLKMITELKLSVLTSNLEDLDTIVDKRNEEFARERCGNVEKVQRIKREVDLALDQLEAHYYSSVYR